MAGRMPHDAAKNQQVETLYCIVNILYSAMKETKRASEDLRKLVFPFGVSRVIFVYLCVNPIV